MLTVYGMSASGNCHKLRLLLDQLQQPCAWREVDIMKGESHTAEFLAMNPNGSVPLLEVDTGVYLPESNAILCYLADGTRFLSAERLTRAQTLRWMFFEQYSHEPYVAVARFICRFLSPDNARRADLPRLLQRGHEALNVMERHLANNHFFVALRTIEPEARIRRHLSHRPLTPTDSLSAAQLAWS